MNEYIKRWKTLIDNNNGDKIVFTTGYLWWKRNYSAKDMLYHIHNKTIVYDKALKRIVSSLEL